MKKVAGLLLVLVPFIGFGAIEPVIIGFPDTNSTYTVPAGKVLVIERIGGINVNHTTPDSLSFIANGSTNVVKVFVSGELPMPFEPSIKVPSGTTIMMNNSSSAPFTILGLLVDPSDLYASIESQSGDMIVGGGLFSFDVITASSRPARIAVEGSSDLASWQPSSATVEKKSPDTYTVSIPVEDEQQYFAKYTVRGSM